MKALRLFLAVLFVSLFYSAAFSQDMQPPPPVQNSFFSAAIGTWKAEPYKMMGMEISNDQNVISMKHNGQFMVVEVDAIDGGGNNYTATIFTTIDGEGNVKGWAFDTWGYYGTMTYTGSANGNTMTITGSNDFVNETRVMTIDGNKMTHDVDFTVKLPTGNMNEKLSIVYNKQ